MLVQICSRLAKKHAPCNLEATQDLLIHVYNEWLQYQMYHQTLVMNNSFYKKQQIVFTCMAISILKNILTCAIKLFTPS